MPITIKYSQVKALSQVMQKLGDVPAAGSAFKVARNLIALKPIEETVDKVNTSVSGFLEFSKKQAALLEKHAKRDDKGQPVREVINTPQGQMARYDLDDPDAYAQDLAPVVEEHKDDITAENTRMATLPEAMDQSVEVELLPIDPEWCEGILNAKEIVVLLECKLC
jgi:hypothetical protein